MYTPGMWVARPMTNATFSVDGIIIIIKLILLIQIAFTHNIMSYK